MVRTRSMRPSQRHSVGFVYVMSRFSPYTNARQPHLMLLGHRPFPGEEFKWGTPGGHRDGKESAVRNCIREFAEETGLLSSRASRQEVTDFMKFFLAVLKVCNGSIRYGVKGNDKGFCSINVIVDHAPNFEALIGITDVIQEQWCDVDSLEARTYTIFSGETQGVMWVPLNDDGDAFFEEDGRTIVPWANPLGKPVLVRRGVFGCGSKSAWESLHHVGP